MSKQFDGSRPAKWFRMWAEFATDPKVQILTEVLQRRFLMLLCLRCSNGDETLQDVSIACYMRVSLEEWASTKQSLLEEGLINERSHPTNWDKRQYCSDVSTDRVRAYRDRKRNVSETLQQQRETVLKRPQRQSTETETENKSKAFARPTLEEVTTYCKSRNNHVDPEKWLAYYTANGFKVGRSAMKDWHAAIITWEKNGFSNGNGGNGDEHKTTAQLRNERNAERIDRIFGEIESAQDNAADVRQRPNR